MAKKPEIDDAGYKKTDEQLQDLEDRLSSLYTKASKELEAQFKESVSGYKEQYAAKQQLYKDGKITKAEFTQWANSNIFMTKKMQAQLDNLTETLVNTDKVAMQMVNGELPSVYSNNYNFQGYKAEKMAQAGGEDYSSFTIYNAEAVSRLMKDDPDLLPAPKVDIPADEKWNKQKINSAITQGIVQGDPIDKIASRLTDVTSMDYSAAVRNARTAVIGAQNAGRKDASERVTKMSGLEMIDVWSCTIDGRTRDTHIALNGQERGKDGYFHTFTGEKLEYPCDPNGAPAEVYNCRCRLNSFIKGIDHSKDDELYEEFMKENDYDSWLKVKEKQDEKRELYDKNKAALEEKLAKERDIPAQPDEKITEEVVVVEEKATKPEPFETKSFEDPREVTEYFRGKTYDSNLGTMGKNNGFGVQEDPNKPATKWEKKLTYDQAECITSYTGENYESINNFLRGIWDKQEAEEMMYSSDFTLKQHIKNMDSAINKYKLDEPITVYRTCEREFLDKLSEGTIFHDEGYGSTSMIPVPAASGDVHFEISVPAGKGVGAYVDGLSWKEGEEWEFLLARGADYYVEAIEERKDGIYVKAIITGFTKET